MTNLTEAYARNNDIETAHEAADSMRPTDLEIKVLFTLRQYGPSTTHELSELMKLSLVTVSPRMAPLVRKGLIQDTGLRRIGVSGRKSAVWKAI